MPSIRRFELPQEALLRKYQRDGAHADCYVTEIARRVTHGEYVEAFYTTALFKAERRLLAWFVAKPSTDIEAHDLAAGTLDTFAAWGVEARSANQMLLSDFRGHTRSWLMVAAPDDGTAERTRLYFGSAVVPVASAGTGTRTLGLSFGLLLAFHKLYSRALLLAAKSRLAQRR